MLQDLGRFIGGIDLAQVENLLVKALSTAQTGGAKGLSALSDGQKARLARKGRPFFSGRVGDVIVFGDSLLVETLENGAMRLLLPAVRIRDGISTVIAGGFSVSLIYRKGTFEEPDTADARRQALAAKIGQVSGIQPLAVREVGDLELAERLQGKAVKILATSECQDLPASEWVKGEDGISRPNKDKAGKCVARECYLFGLLE